MVCTKNKFINIIRNESPSKLIKCLNSFYFKNFVNELNEGLYYALYDSRFNEERAIIIIQILLEHGADINSNMVFYLLFDNWVSISLNILQFLINNGLNINKLGENYISLLHKYVMSNNIEKVQLLLENGANINAQDVFGRTPLIFAAIQNDKRMIELLLEYGADVNIRNGSNKCAEDYVDSSLKYLFKRYNIAAISGKVGNDLLLSRINEFYG
jgi:ankyrin repeat protein